MPETSDPRRPRRVFTTGTEPDPRFTLANERTFLAWIRTALALVATGLALVGLRELGWESVVLPAAGALTALLGGATGLLAYRRWGTTERALRRQRPLPSARALALPLAALLAVVVAVLLVIWGW